MSQAQTTFAATGPATSPSYAQKQINITVQLGLGSFGNSGFNTVQLSGLRSTVAITRSGYPGFSLMNARVYGLTQDVMNQVSTLGKPRPMERLNKISIDAGDSTNGIFNIFHGIIQEAWQELDNAPDTYMTFQCQTGTDLAMTPATPSSFPTGGAAANMIAGIASAAGRGFNNSGVQVILPPTYLSGTYIDQAHAVAAHANIEFYDDGTTFYIWPKLGARTAGIYPLISAQSGLVGYPKYTAQGIKFRCIFNPSIQFGSYIVMQSSIQQACGLWYVNELSYDLAAQFPNGPWFCDVGAVLMPGSPSAS